MATKTVSEPSPIPEAELPILEDAEALFALDDLVTEYVDVPEWRMRLRLRSLSGGERDRMEAEGLRIREAGGDPLVNFRARVVAYHARKADGSRVFKPAQVEALGRKNAAGLARVFDVATRLSGIGEEEVAKAVDELGKDPSEGSGTT